MGNKSTFVMLFLVFGMFFQWSSDAQAGCPDRADACYKGSHYRETGKCIYSISYCDSPSECKRNQGAWSGNACQAKSRQPVTPIAAITPKGIKTSEIVINTPPLNIPNQSQTECPDGSCPANTATDLPKCGPNTNEPFRHILPNDMNTLHNDCTCKYKNSSGVYGKYVAGNSAAESAAACPASDQVATEKAETAEKAAATGLDCIQDIRERINKCKEDSGNAVNACDMKSDKNAETRQQLSNLSQMSQQLIHAGTAEQCKNMGLVTGAAGYGLSSMEKNCNNEMGSCRNSCADLSKYSKPENIIEACETVTPSDQMKLVEEANELARVMTAANNECTTQTESLLQQVGGALKSATVGYASAAQCENQVSNQPVLTNLNLNTCISNPGAAGCPVNCATNPSNAQCACLVNPSAAGCNTGGLSQIAGNPNGIGQNLPALGGLGGLNTKLNSNSNLGGGLDLNIDDTEAAAANAGGGDGTETPAGSMFGKAGLANAGGSGGTGSGEGGKAKNGKGEAAEEEPSLFGGMFQNLKNAAGSLFGTGAGGSSSAKKNQPAGNGFNAAGLKPVAINKNLRGLASNGNTCWVDVKGSRVCFGTKNEDIWTKMNKQYSLQYNTFIIDK